MTGAIIIIFALAHHLYSCCVICASLVCRHHSISFLYLYCTPFLAVPYCSPTTLLKGRIYYVEGCTCFAICRPAPQSKIRLEWAGA